MTTTPSPKLPVVGTVARAWRLILGRPGYAVRTGWIPALALFGAAAGFAAAGAGEPNPGTAFWVMVAAIGNFAMLVLALVAWQRSALPNAKRRRGASALRLGRAEVLAMLHFPLVCFLFIPLLLPELVANLTALSWRGAMARDILLPVAGVAVLVFPGGLVLTRAALILVAIAEAGGHPISLLDSANRVWRLGGGSSIRLFLVVYLSVLPVLFALAVLPDNLPGLARAALHGLLVTLYVLVAGGALSLAYAALGGAGLPLQRKARRAGA
ncbi:MAG: hypothetical protein JSU82_18535 [Rhodospirillales bacterium]|nr:MAG: hypothetical protein JSU82_18535 [Rhodospirillales bacterium]